MNNTCVFCNINNKSHRDSCTECFDEHKNDLIEIIYKDNIGIRRIILKSSQITDAESLIKSFDKVYGVLDLQGVLTTIDPVQLISQEGNKPVAACSYVGKHTDTRIVARGYILERVKSSQIQYGALIFARGFDLGNKNKFHDVGSKAWFVKVVSPHIFIDDSEDHVESVKSLNAKVNSILMKPSDDLLDLITKLY